MYAVVGVTSFSFPSSSFSDGWQSQQISEQILFEVQFEKMKLPRIEVVGLIKGGSGFKNNGLGIAGHLYCKRAIT